MGSTITAVPWKVKMYMLFLGTEEMGPSLVV
jgi:hypothetical protein